MPAALSLLPWSLSHIASVTMSFSVKTILAWILIFSIMGFSTVYIGCMVVRSLNSNNSTRNSDTPLTRQYIGYKYFLFPWLISTPLYIIGWDFGRWFAISCINYIMITLSRELNYAESRFGNDTETKTEIFNQDPTLGESTLLYHINLVFLFIILFFIRMPYAVNNGYNMLAEPLKSLAESLWHALS
jgi:Zn-dependent protease with chaperone function